MGPPRGKPRSGIRLSSSVTSITAEEEIKRHAPKIVRVNGKNRIVARKDERLMSLHKLTLYELRKIQGRGSDGDGDRARLLSCASARWSPK